MDNFTTALGHTLIHSLWQGVALAGLTGLLIVLTRRSSAARLVLFAITTVATFCYQVNQITTATQPGIIHTLPTTALVTNINTLAPVPVTGFWQQLSSYINTRTQTIVLVWFLVVLARSLQLATGLQNLYHLRRKNLYAVNEVWAKRVQDMAAKLGINTLIGIAESGIVKVPMVIGHLKPLILIPVGLLTAINPAEIEAILVHELAHIRRRDYLVNLLQSFMEIVFFFNPAVLWLSALIRTERENCCDDIAVAQTSSKVNYIRALVSCQEYQLAAPAYAMAFPGKRSQLMDRVKRMASGTNHALNLRERSVLFVTLITAGLLTLAFTNATKIGQIAVKTQKAISYAIAPIANDTVLAKLVPLNPVKAKVRATIKTIPADTTIKQEPVEPIEPVVTETNRLSPLSPKATSLTPVGPKSMPLNGKLSPYSADYKAYASQYNANTNTYDKKPYKDVGARVSEELIKDNLINADDKSASYKLSNQEMIVNGVRQPDDIFKRYKDKFVPPINGKGTWTLFSNYNTNENTTATPNININNKPNINPNITEPVKP
jgi:bla regulator protein BlaR1